MIDARYNHPSIVMWVPFNEGWGQFDTVNASSTGRSSTTRPAWSNSASGWNDFPARRRHRHAPLPRPRLAAQPEENRAGVLGEFGGLGLPLEGHMWSRRATGATAASPTRTALTDASTSSLHPPPGIR